MTAFQKENIFHHPCNLKDRILNYILFTVLKNLDIVQKFATLKNKLFVTLNYTSDMMYLLFQVDKQKFKKIFFLI